MKQMIVLCATVILGVFIFGLIMGDGEGTVKNSLKAAWISGVAQRTLTP